MKAASFFLWFMAASFALAKPTDLELLRNSWNTELAKIDQEYMTFIKKYEPLYAKNLQHLEAQMQKAGKLQPMLEVRNERKRFIQARRLDRSQLSETPELRSLQQAYLRATEKAAVSRARKITALALRYQKSLAVLRTNFTKKNMIKSAIQVDLELKAVQEHRDVTEAESLIADYSERTKRRLEAAKLARKNPRKPGDRTGNRFKGSDNSRIKSRFEDLVEHVLKQKYEDAEKIVDPEFVKEHGSSGVKVRVDVLHLMFKIVEGLNGDIEVDKVEIDDSQRAAKVTPEVDYKFRKEPLDPVIFVKVQGDWYMQFDE